MTMAETRTFRATLDAWLGQFLLPLAFFVLLTVTAVRATGLNPWLGLTGLSLLLLIAGLDYAAPMLRNWLRVDGRSIEGSLNGRYFELYWSEVLAAWVYENRRRHFLCMGTRQGTIVVPLRFFDHCAVWDVVRTSVPPSALEECAIQALPDYQEWVNARAEALEDDEPRAVSDHWLVQVVGWAALTFFALGLFQAEQEGSLGKLFLFTLLAAISAVVLMNWGVTELSAEKVTRHTLPRTWSIAWQDVQLIEMDPLNSVIVFSGEGVQLVIPGPGVWGAAGKKAALALLVAQAERRKIPVQTSLMALFRVSRGTRQKR